MRNLRKRIEAVQKTFEAKLQARQAIFRQALRGFSLAAVEQLISACGSDRQGRRLNPSEAGARQAYRAAVEDACRRAGTCAPSEHECEVDIYQAIVMVVADRISREELDQLVSADQAARYGFALDSGQTVALEAYTAQWARLCQLAGFASPQELERYRAQTELWGEGTSS